MSASAATVTAGTSVTTVCISAGFVAEAIPYLQAASFIVGIIVGVLTAIYTFRRIRAKKYD